MPHFEASDPLVLVRCGSLELRRVSPEGRVAVLHRAGPGDTFAEASVFELRHHCDGVAPVAAQITLWPAATLRRAARQDAALAWGLAAHLASRLVEERARSQRLRLPRARDRLLDALSALPAGADGLRRLERSWTSLAAELGLTHEATYRALARLEQEGALQREGTRTIRLATGGLSA